MNTFLIQTVLAARNTDTEGWMNILFVVVLAIFWAIGGILKAKSGKFEQEKEKQLPGKPRRKAPEADRGIWDKSFEQQSRRPAGPAPHSQIIRPQSAVRKFAPKAEQPTQLQPVEPLELKKRTISPLETLRAKAIIEEPLLDYTDPDKLKRAILHYEIIGKPLSLRGPAGPP
jgi:hypothetical protein